MDLEQFLDALKEMSVKGKGFKPHKHLALLAILDLIENQELSENKFYFDEAFRNSFTKRFDIYHNIEDKNRPLAPFFHLKNTGFWLLSPLQGKEEQLRNMSTVGAPRELHEVVDHAYVLPEIYKLFQDSDCRNIIRNTIIDCLELGLAAAKNSSGDDELHERQTSYSLFQHESQAIDQISGAIKRFTLGKYVSNLLVYDEGTRDYYECDVIIVGYCGIYLVELKHWTGHIRVAPYNWGKDHVKHRRDPHANNTFKAKILKGIYQHQFRTYPADLRVESVVVLTNPEAEVVGASNPKVDKHCPTFESIESFIDYLRHQNATKPRLLSIREIDRVVEYLQSLQQPKRATRYSIPGHEVVEHLTQRPDLIELVARPTIGRLRNLMRFRVFFPPAKAQPVEKERFIRRARNTLEAVAQIGEHPNVLRVWPVPDEAGALIEGSEWSEQGTLRDWILSQQGPVGEQEALRIGSGILRALDAAHGKGVVHRAVKPENVLMVSGEPKLMNFDLSYQLAAQDCVTVIPDVSVLERDAYTAPEIYSRKDLDESTDLFSVGVILFELLTGERPFKVSSDLEKAGGRLGDESLSKLSDKGISEHVLKTIEQLVRSERTQRIQSTQEVLSLLEPMTEVPEATLHDRILNQKLEPGASYDVYTIERLMGEGTEAQVYEARTLRKETVALKIFNRDIPVTRILDEEQAAGSVKSSYLAHARRSGHWNNDRYFIVMDYIDGRLMRDDITTGKRPDKETFTRVASCLLEAVLALHHRELDEGEAPLMHGDIKPDNIILTPDGSAVLFDFGCAGPPRIDSYQGTEGYVPPDLMSGSDLQFCESGDLFALGVSLFEWLCGVRPYETPRLGEPVRLPPDIQVNFPSTLIDWLIKAVQTDSEARFRDIGEMKDTFAARLEGEAAILGGLSPEVEPDKTGESPVQRLVVVAGATLPGNPFVAYLNTLHNASANNGNIGELQALSPYFPHIHVPLKVTDHIVGQLEDQQGPHVILTGHAGDGKTTIGLELFKRCMGVAPEDPLPRNMLPREEIHLGGREVVLIKDMSELTEKERLELLRDAVGPGERRYFIISNTGTLLNSFKGLAGGKAPWHTLQNQLLAALESGAPFNFRYQDGLFQVINLVRTDNISTACEIFGNMLAPERWEPCESSDCREHCPIYTNVRMLREHWDIVRDRVELTYRRLFEYGSRLTRRHITGHLAYSITAGLNYEDITQLAGEAMPPPLRHYLFFNRFFGDCGDIPDPSADKLKAVREVRALEPGRRTHQRLERRLWMTEDGGDIPTVRETAKTFYSQLREVGSHGGQGDGLAPESARLQVRRMIFLFGRFSANEAERNFVSTFLVSPMIVDFSRWQRHGGALPALEKNKLTQGSLHVLQEHFTGIRLPENAGDHENIYITLNRRNYEIRQSAQIVLKKLQADRFELILQPVDSGIGDTRYDPKLREGDTQKVLSLDLPFLDYVTNRFHGEIAQRLQSFYSDRLERFKVQLLDAKEDDKGNNMMLIRLQLNHRFKSQTISVCGNVLEVF